MMMMMIMMMSFFTEHGKKYKNESYIFQLSSVKDYSIDKYCFKLRGHYLLKEAHAQFSPLVTLASSSNI